MQVLVANRQRAAHLLDAVLPALPAQQEHVAELEQYGTEIRDFVLLMRSLKRQAKKEQRKAEQASKVAALKEHGSGHKIRPPRAAALHALQPDVSDLDDDDDDDDSDGGDTDAVQLPLRGDALVDPWAVEGDDPAAALCAICGDGTSSQDNPVVFCERCNVPVHKLCYGIDRVPDGEWLCWPCLQCAPLSPLFCTSFAPLHVLPHVCRLPPGCG